ncbi:MAG: alanine dehydrogenase [Candidatus Nezhaarchaeota archaeon]|nr:alanine dehydrogenase [Candidatus Nezhaarchaeota archaeon]
MTPQTLLLTYREVLPLIEMREAIEKVEEAFKLKALGKVRMPPKLYVDLPEHGGDVRSMPVYVEDWGLVCVKVVNSHPRNPSERGIRAVMAIIELLDPSTGRPLAIMDGTLLTDLRTGAAGAVAAKYLAKPSVERVGFIGAGRQAYSQLEALFSTYGPSIKEVRAFDVARPRALEFVNAARGKYGLEARAVEDPREAVASMDIVVTATPSRRPVVMSDWVSPGTHFNCIGADAPGKQELDPRILLRAKLVVDDVEQAVHGGEPNVPIAQGVLKREHIYAELGEVVAGLKPGRVGRDEVTVFSSTGLAVQDLAVAKLVYEKALRAGVGSLIDLVPP